MTYSTLNPVALIGAFRQQCTIDTVAAISQAVPIQTLYHPKDDADIERFGVNSTQPFQNLRVCLRENFQAQTPIVALCATGIVIRALADLLHDKYNESPVLVIAEDGSCVIPLLGGHRGGNHLAQHIAQHLQITPAITTASERSLGFGLDMPPRGWKISHHSAINSIMARLLAKQPVRLVQEFPEENFPPTDAFCAEASAYTVRVSDHDTPNDTYSVTLHPPSLVVGVGCERHCPVESVDDVFSHAMSQHQLSTLSIAAIATVTLKADEPALHALAEKLDVPIKLFTPAELEKLTPKVQYPSEIVYQEVGCHSVAEAAALACAGTNAECLVAKAKNSRATISLVRRSSFDALAGQELGELHIIGTGPGDQGNQTLAAREALKRCSVAIGYGLYLDLVQDLIINAQQHRSALGDEQQRVEQAIAETQKGYNVALICSGDPGIYALATLVFEVIELQKMRPQFRLTVYPGITAMQAAAAKLGAPLGHDFLAISLSDLLTPPDTIRSRLHAAATGDFVTSIYNPQSRTRRTLLPEAKQIFLAHRPADTPVAICRNIGRVDETFIKTTLAEFDPVQVDMFSLVIIGSSMTRTTRNLSQTHIYTPRGYVKPIRTRSNAKD
ncbi:MAG: precorrin-3B C(17)-methyltransferase [Alphaproteobacteria bacterium]|nr:precorrin-3B C(17)-methyltransferase [Alphaproteobacteria bacterium]